MAASRSTSAAPTSLNMHILPIFQTSLVGSAKSKHIGLPYMPHGLIRAVTKAIFLLFFAILLPNFFPICQEYGTGEVWGT